MDVIRCDAGDRAAWDAYVDGCPRTVAWQRWGWSEAVDRHYPCEFLPLAAVERSAAGTTIRGVLPLYRLEAAHAPRRLISVPYAVAGGLTADSPEAARLLLDAAIEQCRRAGLQGLTFKQYRYPIEASLQTDPNYFNRELNLTVGAGRLWDQLDPHNRAMLDGADHEAWELEHPSERIDAFYRLLLRFMTRGGVPCPSIEWIRTLQATGMYTVAMLRRDGRLEAATLVKTFRRTVSFPFTCLSPRARRSGRAAFVLYWRLISHYASAGYEIFHSGRMPQNEAVERYRLGWGGEKFPYYYQYYPPTGERTEFQNKRGWKRVLVGVCWKYLPAPVAEALGPRIVARFP